MGESNETDWGAQPADEPNGEIPDGVEIVKVPAESVFFKMKASNGDDVEINMLQAINQLFIDMGHFDARVRELEGDSPENPIIKL